MVVVGRSPGEGPRHRRGGRRRIPRRGLRPLGQVRDLAAALQARHPRIDVLINNAGLIAGGRRTVTADEHELTFQVNHLAPFPLTMLLKDCLLRASQLAVLKRQRVIGAGEPVVVTEFGLRTYRRAGACEPRESGG